METKDRATGRVVRQWMAHVAARLEPGEDILEGARRLMVLEAWRLADKDRVVFMHLLAKPWCGSTAHRLLRRYLPHLVTRRGPHRNPRTK